MRPASVDEGKLLAQLREMGAVGSVPEGGRTRHAASDADGEARDLLVRWMREIDLDVRVDRIGNIFGILAGENGSLNGACMVGSHIDTVTNAGPLDGCYGVLSGLAVARAFQSEGIRPKRPLIVAAFTNEEGVRFQPDMMGSLAFAGGISAEAALAATDDEGRSLGSELERIGYAGREPLPFATPDEYLELHVEQGPILDREGIQIGVVEGVQGIWWWRITVRGAANHAGTTPLILRHDAGYAAARIVTFLREMAKAAPATLATVGTMAFRPGSINVVPSEAVFTVDLRDPERARLLAAEEKIAAFIEKVAEEEGVSVTMDQLVRFDPVAFDGDLAGLIERAAVEKGFSARRMASGAGHDAQMMARLCRAAMIFVPSRGGVSHSPEEYTEDDQLIRGTEVLLRVVSGLICP